ncbi:general odorant-binding protein 45-like [Ochlerotatus camptorhynchus]|uniref:general odorant-binding protein 45-like n=1 Tax=Ochlerotatus camptorhynchus TaxID=644619 RepID=UPI0031CE69A5
MNFFIGLLIAAIAATASAVYYPPSVPSSEVEESHYAYQLKSFRQELDECAEYLQISSQSVDNLVASNYVTDDSNLKCLIRCAGINAGWWGVGGNYSGLHAPVIESYFQPACDDTCYAKRTKECLDSKVIKCQDDCSQAYESFLCYYHQYGNLKSSEEYIPLPQLDAIQAAIDCILILRTPSELLEQYSQGVFPAAPETQCLYRCQYIAEGLYDGVTINLTRIYIRNWYAENPTPIKSPETQACIDSALNNNACNECARVYKASSCTDNYANPHHTSAILEAASKLVLSQKTCNDEDLSPKYNAGTPEPTPCQNSTVTPDPPAASPY